MRSRIGRSLNSTRRLAQMLGTLFENVLLQDSEDAADWAAVNLYKPGEREARSLTPQAIRLFPVRMTHLNPSR